METGIKSFLNYLFTCALILKIKAEVAKNKLFIYVCLLISKFYFLSQS